MLDRERIKVALIQRGMTLSVWAKARGLSCLSVSRALCGRAGKELEGNVRNALASDGLLFEKEEEPVLAFASSVFWRFPDAAQYLGIPERLLRKWEKSGGFPRAIRVGSTLLLRSESVKKCAEDLIARQGELPEEREGV